MKRKASTEFKKARREMIERKTKCNECEDYATDLHHIMAVEDGGTDDRENLVPLCNRCHKEYTSEQTTERNKVWVELNIGEDGEMTTRCSGDKIVEHLGNISDLGPRVVCEEKTTTTVPVHYEYEWIVTVEIPAMNERGSKEKLDKLRTELFHRYAVTDDVWLTGIRRWNRNKKRVVCEEKTTTTVPVHYEYEWIVTVEIPAMNERESKEKLDKLRTELFHRYAVTDDVWLTGIQEAER